MPEPLVSIIIPVYNAEKYLAYTIQSAIAQTWPNKEIIVVDDGSTDNSLAIAKTFEGQSVKIFNQKNKGASSARNKGLQEAKGEYIQFLDADDLLSINKIAEQMQALQFAAGKVAVCSTVHFNDGDDLSSNRPSAYEEAFLFNSNNPVYFLVNLWGGYSDHGSMVQPNAWLTPAHLIKKAGNWNELLSVDDDGEFFCRILLASAGVIKTGGLNFYRKHGNSTNLSAGKKLKNYASLYNSLKLRYQHIANTGVSEHLKIAYIKSLYDLKNNIYPLFPRLKKEINNSINNLNMNISYDDSSTKRLKKIVFSLLNTYPGSALRQLFYKLK